MSEQIVARCPSCGQDVPHRAREPRDLFPDQLRAERHAAGCGLPCMGGGVDMSALDGGLVHEPGDCPRCDADVPPTYTYFSRLFVGAERARHGAGLDGLWADVQAGGSWTTLAEALRGALGCFGVAASGEHEVRIFRQRHPAIGNDHELAIASWMVSASGDRRIVIHDGPVAQEVWEAWVADPELPH